MKRGKRIKARNPKRKVKAFARAYHSAARVKWRVGPATIPDPSRARTRTFAQTVWG